MSKDIQTIDIGIDLGTTNSAIAISRDGEVETIRNAQGSEYTPSVFGIRKSGDKIVGKQAFEKRFRYADSEELKNNEAEVKRKMGTDEKIHFPRNNSEYTPEQISAEILKSLKESVGVKYPDFPTNSAVITIPAYFKTVQAEATKRAGELAGFEYVQLLQEPIAAAMSYGFMEKSNENWLVYDLGGGTFDVALVSSDDGELSVIGHHGDNYLGGKDFDDLIIDKKIVPAILEEYNLRNFNRDSDEYKAVFAKLKGLAEKAKIELSQYEDTSIEVERIGTDDNGEEMYLNIDLSREEFEGLILPKIKKTIRLAKETINDSGLSNSNVDRTVLVGASTKIPLIRKQIEEELDIKVDTSANPLTAVANGACIYGQSQKVPKGIGKESSTKDEDQNKKTDVSLDLNYEPLSSDTEEVISGKVDGLSGKPKDYSIKIQSESGFYNSKKISLEGGTFFQTIPLEEQKENKFWIYLFDNEGERVDVEPDSFSITHGMSVSDAPIPHSVGVAVTKRDFEQGFDLREEMDVFFEKGDTLPLEETKTYESVKEISKSDTDDILHIKAYEGESEKPDRNMFVCDVNVDGSDIPYDLPRGSDIDIAIKINKSRELVLEAYIPDVDLSLDARASVHDEDINIEELQSDLDSQEDRYRKIKEADSDLAREIGSLIESARKSLSRAEKDEDQKRKASKEIKEIKSLLDKLEKERKLPQMKEDFNNLIKDANEVIDKLGSDDKEKGQRDQLRALKEQGEEAIKEQDKYLLMRTNEQIRDFVARVMREDPATWVHWFQRLSQENHNFINEEEARYYLNKGKNAMDIGDVDTLKDCVKNLMMLLPAEESGQIKGDISGITYKQNG